MKAYTITEDKLFLNFLRSKPNISAKTKQHYKSALIKFYKANQEQLETIIHNCKSQQDRIIEKTISQGTDEQGNQIIEKQIIKFDVNSPNSYANIYINKFIDYCKATNVKTNTINNYLTQILAVLTFYDVKLPTIEKFDRTPPKWTLLSKEDFKFVINDGSLMYAALIKFLMSSGMRISDALSLTIGDFMNATSDYHNFVDVEDFIDNAPTDMIGYYRFHPNKTRRFNIECQTFNDPESSNLILQHLRKLKNEYYPYKNNQLGLNLTPSKNDAVFGSQKAFFKRNLTQESVSDTFYKKNIKLKNHHISLIDEKIMNGELSIEDRDKMIAKIPKFHAHSCRKFFSSMIAKNCGNLRICAILEGHTSPLKTDGSYIEISLEDIKEAYMSALEDLSLENTETKVYTSEVRREMEEKIAVLEQELESKTNEVNTVNDRVDSIEKILGDLGIENIVDKVKK
ncbi:MAG: site-specific integrase [Methanobrevibacter sp.]|nr:site-specific integrase [Methanobrevibacter sp.]